MGRDRMISVALLAVGVGALACLDLSVGAEATTAGSDVEGHSRTIDTTVKVMAADGARVAFITRSLRGDCEHVVVWTPATRSVRRFPVRPEPCTGADTIGSVALAGTRPAWLWATTTGIGVETGVITATLAHPTASAGFRAQRRGPRHRRRHVHSSPGGAWPPACVHGRARM